MLPSAYVGLVVEEEFIGAGVDPGELEHHAVAVVGGRNRIGQGRGEGRADQVESSNTRNNLIRRIKRAAFGFRNLANYRIRAILCVGNLNRDLLAAVTLDGAGTQDIANGAPPSHLGDPQCPVGKYPVSGIWVWACSSLEQVHHVRCWSLQVRNGAYLGGGGYWSATGPMGDRTCQNRGMIHGWREGLPRRLDLASGQQPACCVPGLPSR